MTCISLRQRQTDVLYHYQKQYLGFLLSEEETARECQLFGSSIRGLRIWQALNRKVNDEFAGFYDQRHDESDHRMEHREPLSKADNQNHNHYHGLLLSSVCILFQRVRTSFLPYKIIMIYL